MRITEIRTFNPPGLPEEEGPKAKYLAEVEAWGKEGVEGENRAQVVSKIKAFIKNPEETSLSFENNRLKTLPPLDFIAERIKVFDLNGNRFTELPESLEKLHNLKILRVSRNQLQEIPEWLGRELHNLAFLSVSDNPDLKEIPLSLLDSLNFKKIDSTGTEITKTLKELRQKRQEDRAEIAFHLFSGKILPRLPESSVLKVDHFIKERSLYLEKLEDWEKEGVEGENRAKAVSEINAFIEDPEKTKLSFDNCHLKTLPPLDFIAQRIQSLRLSDNQLQEIPESLEKLHNLVILNVSRNKLQELPEWLGREFHNLESLDLCFNELKEIPKSIAKLHKLKELYLSSNQISTLPEWLGRELHNLAFLSVVGNRNLQSIPVSLLNSPNFIGLASEGTQIIKTLEELRVELTEMMNLNLILKQPQELPESLRQPDNLKALFKW